MAKKQKQGVSSIDIASALDNIVSRTTTDRNKLKIFAERLFGWSKDAAKAHDDLIIAQDKQAIKDQRDQIDAFIVSHIEGDQSCLKDTHLVAIDISAVFWATTTLKGMVARVETFCKDYENILKAMQGHRAGYGRLEHLQGLLANLTHDSGIAAHTGFMCDNALKAYTMMCPSSFSCLYRTQELMRATRTMMTSLEKLRDAHQLAVSNSYRYRHQASAQQRFAA